MCLEHSSFELGQVRFEVKGISKETSSVLAFEDSSCSSMICYHNKMTGSTGNTFAKDSLLLVYLHLHDSC